MEERVEAFNQSNDGYTSAGVIQLRLDTGPMLDQLEAFFRGTRIVGYEEVDGVIKPKFGKHGKAKMNNEGVQSLMSWLTPLFSPATVQGNFGREEFFDYLTEIEIDLRDYVMTNLHNWKIRVEDYNGIVDMIVKTAWAFFSRAVDNKERESYASTMKTVQSTSETHGRPGFLGMFGGGN